MAKRLRRSGRRKTGRKRRESTFFLPAVLIVIFLAAVIVIRAFTDSQDAEGSAEQDVTAMNITVDTGEEENSLTELEQQLEEMLDYADGTWSVYVKDLETGDELSMNNSRMYAASLIKLYVMESCFAHEDELIENDSIYSGDVSESSSKVEDLLQAMIEVSDNESYNELVRMHSSERSFTEGCLMIADYIEERGYVNTGIFHTLHPSDTDPEYTSDNDNYTCVEDCGALLESIYNGTCVSEEASEEMLELLFEQQVQTKPPAGLPDGVVCANKTGETDEVEHDAAIVFGPETDYILCLMSSDVYEDTEAAEQQIREISSLVYEYLNGAD